MSAVGDLAGGALWKAVALVLLILLLAAGARWRLAAHDRDVVGIDLALERERTADLAASVREQNRAVGALALATNEARARGAAAQQQAATAGRRLDGALAQIAGARATTCDEAMPAVNALLEAVR